MLEPSSPLNVNALQLHCVAATLLLGTVTQRTTPELRQRAVGLYREVSERIEVTTDEILAWAKERKRR